MNGELDLGALQWWKAFAISMGKLQLECLPGCDPLASERLPEPLYAGCQGITRAIRAQVQEKEGKKEDGKKVKTKKKEKKVLKTPSKSIAKSKQEVDKKTKALGILTCKHLRGMSEVNLMSEFPFHSQNTPLKQSPT